MSYALLNYYKFCKKVSFASKHNATNVDCKICLFKPQAYNCLSQSQQQTHKICEMCSKLTLEQSQWHRSDVFIINFEHIHTFF